MTASNSDMVERVARAIFPSCAPFEGKGCCNAPDFEKCRECADDVRELARAAIAAMREPTEAMLAAAWKSTQSRSKAEYMAAELCAPKDAHDMKMKHRYRAMIDAALGESP